MTDGNTHAIAQHLDDQEDWDELQEVTVELEQAKEEAKKYHDAWLEAEAQIVELKETLAAVSQSRGHFKSSAKRQKKRCHNLRHRQRSLRAALLNIKDCTSIEDAKFVAYIAWGGWEDDELVYKSRTIAELKGQDDE